MDMNTSIVIPLGNGSHWNNTELRFALRSVEKHLSGHGDIFIVGEKPEWLRNVVHIPFDEGFAPQSHEKERNIFNKIMAACGDERVSDSFLFMNDDHFLLTGYQADHFPLYYQGRIGEFLTVTDYKHTVYNTVKAVTSDNPVYTDVHCPIIYNKEKFRALSRYDWSVKFGYCIKTLYCHHWGQVFTKCTDLKINEPCPYDKLWELTRGRHWFSIGDQAQEGELLQLLKEFYPHKSIYET